MNLFSDGPIHYERALRGDFNAGGRRFSLLTWREPWASAVLKGRGHDAHDFADAMFGALRSDRDKAFSTLGISAALEKSGDVKPGHAAAQFNIEYSTWAFRREGRQVFRVSPWLCDALAETDLDVDSEALAMPHGAFYVEVPRGRFRLHDPMSGAHSLEGFYVAEDPWGSLVASFSENGDDRGGTIDRILEMRNKVGLSEPPTRSLRFLAVGEDKGELGDTVFHFRIDVGPGTLDKHVAYGAGMPLFDRLERTAAEMRNAENIGRFFRFAMNVVLYVNSKGAERAAMLPERFRAELGKVRRLGAGTPKGRRAREAAEARYTSLPKTVLGLTEPEGWEAGPDGPPGARSLGVRFRVRGHWRHYSAERYSEKVRGTTAWVMPFWKGPEMADEAARTYAVKGAK